MREVATVVVVVAVGGMSVWLLSGCGGSSSSQSSPPQPENSAVAAAQRFLERYVDSDGRVVRRDQGGDTVGEGQAYGMLMAAAIGDAQHFDSIWTWTQQNLRRPDGLISFLWQNGRVIDPQAASDADLDASRALLLASCRFHRPEYRREAVALGDAILRVETTTVNGMPVLVAGPWAITLRRSCWTQATSRPPPTRRCMPLQAILAGTGSRRARARSRRSWCRVRTDAAARLGAARGGKPVPIGSPSAPQSPALFGFDAVRTLVRYAEDPNPAGQADGGQGVAGVRRTKPDQAPGRARPLTDSRWATR